MYRITAYSRHPLDILGEAACPSLQGAVEKMQELLKKPEVMFCNLWSAKGFMGEIRQTEADRVSGVNGSMGPLHITTEGEYL